MALGLFHIRRLGKRADAGIVDQNIQPAPFFESGLQHARHVAGRGDIDADSGEFRALQPRKSDIGYHHPGAFGHQPGGDRRADPSGAASDDRHLARKPAHLPAPCYRAIPAANCRKLGCINVLVNIRCIYERDIAGTLEPPRR